jgi:hypothetical protein
VKNKRNTRRGRAKRWINFYGGWFLRHVEVSPRVASLPCGGWELVSWDIDGYHYKFTQFHSRAAAMRAAEHLARGR